jgi:ATP-dependent 26S proteasome regulatory subunit
MMSYRSAIEHLDDMMRAVLELMRTGAVEALARCEERAAATADLPWERLRTRLGLTVSEARALAVVVVLELDGRARKLMRQASDDAAKIWPDVGVLADLVYRGAERPRMVAELALDATLFEYRLLETVGSSRQVEDAPFVARPLRAARRVLELVHGTWRLDPDVAAYAALETDGPGLDHLLAPDAVKRSIVELLRAAAERREASPVVVVTGHPGGGRAALLRAAAAPRPTLRIACGSLPSETRELARAGQALLREARLFDAMPLLDGLDELLGDSDASRLDRSRALDRAVLADFPGAIAATAQPAAHRRARFDRGAVVVELPMPSEAERAIAWRRALGDDAAAVCDDAAARYTLTPGAITRAAASALEDARARGAAPERRDVHAGVRTILDDQLSTLGVRVTWRQTWSDLVLPEELVDEVREFIGRVRHRRRVYDEWGFARKVAKGLGLSALFSGPPGTGKTMVAGIIADELGLDLYQIDLARIVSKYVGETEKNLAQVFDAAEAGHAILLFDEADSLFAKRTEVKSSVDRYANLEVNYLLQRMEAFRGITILTTNNDSAIDDAFRRRLSVRIDFPMPDPDERQQLWRSLLPDEAKGPDLDDAAFEKLAERYVMSGGYIRNAVLRAAFLAAEDGGAITTRHLQRAAALEYAAMGKVMNWS